MPDDGSKPQLERRAAVFINGRSRAVRIPKVFEFDADEVLIRQVGEELILRPVPRRSGLLDYLATAEPIADDFDFGDDLPAEPVDL
jgi:antitoxin VapB